MAYGHREDASRDRGRDGAMNAAPPSEPDWRVSRIRLSRLGSTVAQAGHGLRGESIWQQSGRFLFAGLVFT
jgi:hypothetical protein